MIEPRHSTFDGDGENNGESDRERKRERTGREKKSGKGFKFFAFFGGIA